MFFKGQKIAAYLKLSSISPEQLSILIAKIKKISELNKGMRLFLPERIALNAEKSSALCLIFNWNNHKDNNYIQFGNILNYQRDTSFTPTGFDEINGMLDWVIKKFKINPINLKLSINLIEIKYKNAPTTL